MPVTVRLDDIVEALETLVEESPSYLDLDTGQVVSVSEDLLSEAEEDGDEEPDLPDWQKHEWEIAKRIVSTDRFLELPTTFDLHEWGIMQDFSRSAEPVAIRADLERAITVREPSGISRTPFGGKESNQPGMHSGSRP